MAVLVTILTTITAVSLILLCLFGDYPWEWLVMNPFAGALGGYVGMALRNWIQETHPGRNAHESNGSKSS